MTPYGIAADVVHIPAFLHGGTAERCVVRWACGATARRAMLFTGTDKNDSWLLGVTGRCEGCFEPAITKAKKAASLAVNKAIQNGTLSRGPCESCGATRNIHGHHDDYNYPLSVRWLCGSCHKKWHHRNKAVGPRLEAVAS